MKDFTQEELEASRPQGSALSLINFCLGQLYDDRTRKLTDGVAQNLSYEELIGALLEARDELEALEVEEKKDDTDLMMGTALRAFENWKHGEQTGDWQPLRNMLTADADAADWYYGNLGNGQRALETNYYLDKCHISVADEKESVVTFDLDVTSHHADSSGVDGRRSSDSKVTLFVWTHGDKVSNINHVYYHDNE